MTEELRAEQRIMIMMRKTLTKVVRDTTPSTPGLSRLIADDTVEDIRKCLGMISERERELAAELGIEVTERPRYADEPKTSNVVSMSTLKTPSPKPEDS
ncbi:MAG: segregation and condensation protein A [Thiotrichales bacterium]